MVSISDVCESKALVRALFSNVQCSAIVNNYIVVRSTSTMSKYLERASPKQAFRFDIAAIRYLVARKTMMKWQSACVSTCV